jgi:hypothetical protein
MVVSYQRDVPAPSKPLPPPREVTLLPIAVGSRHFGEEKTPAPNKIRSLENYTKSFKMFILHQNPTDEIEVKKFNL